MARFRRNGGRDKDIYEALLNGEKDDDDVESGKHRSKYFRHRFVWLFGYAMIIAGLVAWFDPFKNYRKPMSCENFRTGYECKVETSRLWGQYSPWFQVKSAIDPGLPSGCDITFAQMLSRHGARFPTDSKSDAYKATVDKIRRTATSFPEKYAFLEDYVYRLGKNDLTPFGQQQLVNSGTKFYHRYRDLAQTHTVFVRAGSSERVVQSAENFTQGFHAAKTSDPKAGPTDPLPQHVVVINEEDGFNCTLGHGLCAAFESNRYETPGKAQSTWSDIFIPPIRDRVNTDLGIHLDNTEIIYLMDMCPFDTVADMHGMPSPFCDIFTAKEWADYNHHGSLGKFYGYGAGHSLGPTQGVGFANELLSRMTQKLPVRDHTSVNHTLDSDPRTFPVGSKWPLFADFSHDTDMTAIFFALGLYAKTPLLSNTSLPTLDETHGYSSAWTVPFAARAYFEKMRCRNGADEDDDELVRVLINDRVIPLNGCGADALGRCRLNVWISSLEFVRNGGHWDRCFAGESS